MEPSKQRTQRSKRIAKSNESKDPILVQLREFGEYLHAYWDLVPVGDGERAWPPPLQKGVPYLFKVFHSWLGNDGILSRDGDQFWTLLVYIKQRSWAIRHFWNDEVTLVKQVTIWTAEEAWRSWKTPLRKAWRGAKCSPRRQKHKYKEGAK